MLKLSLASEKLQGGIPIPKNMERVLQFIVF